MKTPYAIIIMDGYGLNPEESGNAIFMDGSKNVNELRAKYPSARLGASGLSVGLPDGQMGNSEVGHLNMGAGRIVYQDLTKITKAIDDGEFFKNEALISAMDGAKANNKKLHLWGLLSDGGVHSHLTHLFALLEMAKKRGVPQTFVHCFMDGRDVSPTSGVHFVKELQNKMNELNYGEIASLSGRYYSMDRDNNWDRLEKSYDMLTLGTGLQKENPVNALEESYANGVTDEFVLPTNIMKNGKPVALVEKGDSVIFFNFRPDRAREITRAFSQKEFTVPKGTAFERKTGFLELNYVCFTKVATYDLQPEMSAPEVTDRVLQELRSGKYDAMILNFANCDMVGHTGVIPAAVKAVHTVDECVKRVVDQILAMGGSAILTADHGNADRMLDTDGSPFTAHTTNPVPVVLVSEKYKSVRLRKDGVLADVAPTLLEVMGLPVPAEMTGTSLIIRHN